LFIRVALFLRYWHVWKLFYHHWLIHFYVKADGNISG
jgi:hypothetical protein